MLFKALVIASFFCAVGAAWAVLKAGSPWRPPFVAFPRREVSESIAVRNRRAARWHPVAFYLSVAAAALALIAAFVQ